MPTCKFDLYAAITNFDTIFKNCILKTFWAFSLIATVFLLAVKKDCKTKSVRN